MNNSVQKRQELGLKLKTAGCSVDMEGTDWQTVGDLAPPAEEIRSSPPQGAIVTLDDLKPLPTASKLNTFKSVFITPISRTTGDKEYKLEKADESGVLIRLPNGVLVRVPKADYIESWDDSMEKPKLILKRKYFQ